MSDRFPAEITIGGELTEQTLQKLIEAAAMDGARNEWDEGIADEQDFRKVIIAREPMRLYDPEACYGHFEGLENFCQDNDLSYWRHNEARYEHDAEMVYWSPGMQEPRSVPSDQGGNVLVRLEDLKEAREKGRTLQDVIGDHAQLDSLLEDVPPLRVVEVAAN